MKQHLVAMKNRYENKIILINFFGSHIIKGTIDQVQDIVQALEYHK